MIDFSGIVKKGQQRGKRLGFPTANINLFLSIPEGIYISEIEIENEKFSSITFIGKAVTYNEEQYQAETYIFNFEKDIYGKKIFVRLLKKIRDNQRFTTEEKLVQQMKADIIEAERYFFKKYEDNKSGI